MCFFPFLCIAMHTSGCNVPWCFTYVMGMVRQLHKLQGTSYHEWCMARVDLNPLDPNPAISAHAVFPQSGHIRPEKQPFFQNFPHFSRLEPAKKYYPHTGFQYIKLKPVQFPVKHKGNDFVVIDICALVRL